MGKKLDFAETISWLRQFFSSVVVFTILGVFIRYYYNSLTLGIIISIIGIILGVVYAEWIRKKHGNSAYYNPLYNSNEKKDK